MAKNKKQKNHYTNETENSTTNAKEATRKQERANNDLNNCK